MPENSFKQISGEWVWVADAKVIENGAVRDGVFALPSKDLQEYGRRGQGAKIAQFYKLVLPGLILTRHVFVGLRRGLFNDDNADSDTEKLVYTRKPTFDVEWEGGKHGKVANKPPPAQAVFAVIVSPNIKHRDKFPEIDGYIGTWNWLREDTVLAEAPVDWVDRYDRKIWTRSD